jgi:Na+/proline symporter
VESFFGVLSLLLIGIGFLGSPQVFVRFISLRSPREIRRGAAVAVSWTLLALSGAVLTGMVGRHLLVDGGQAVDAALGSGGQEVVPELVGLLMPGLLAGVFIAVVLSAIMSTIDSLLVVASSALVRDWHQKVRRPETPDHALVSLSRRVTFALALAALAVALTVAATTPDRTIFWFVIFGWSGISATFCPTMILSVFWPGMTARGALASMLVGFSSVPLFKFVAPELPAVGPALAELSELPPAFAAATLVGIGVSVLDPSRAAHRAAAAADLDAAAR